jgi:uncharacterized GH25 family protein
VSQAAKILLPVLLLGGLAGGAWYMMSTGPARPPAPPVPASAPEQPAQPQRTVTPEQPDKPPERPPENRTVVQLQATNADAPQGVRGRVLQPGGSPAANVPVYMLKAMSSNYLEVYLKQKTGGTFPPVANGKTAADGTFSLGITVPGQTYDLRVVPENFPELNFSNIKVREGEWVDAHDLQLEPGVIVQGRVTAEDGGAPVANAKVNLRTQNQTAFLVPTPGHENGVQVLADNGGFFRFNNAPHDGLITLSAEAPDFAAVERTGLQIKPDALNEFNLELARGTPISGVVVDTSGKPIGGAQLTAVAQSSKVPSTTTTKSSSDGTFATANLRDGPYKLTATAGGYEDKTIDTTAGEELKVVLDQRCQVKLRVLSARGVPVKVYSLSLRRYFPNNPGAIGKVLEFPDNQRITPADYHGDWATIRNVPVGEFVFQIADSDHAKTLSQPFQVTAGQTEAPQVEATLTMGAGITGLVVDDRGQPVAGATVSTDMNGGFAADDGGILTIFKDFMPEKHTATSTQTDGGGRFVIRRLAFADYMLRIAHPAFCEGVSLDIKLDSENELRDVGTITLMRGAVVEGLCSVGGAPAGQIKVQVGPPEGAKPETDAKGGPKMFFSTSAITDNDGHFRLLKRVPPGSYKIYASRHAGDQKDIFSVMMDMKETARQLQIGAGQEQSTQNFELRPR